MWTKGRDGVGGGGSHASGCPLDMTTTGDAVERDGGNRKLRQETTCAIIVAREI